MNQDLLETVIANPPQAHKGDTEVSNEKVFRGSSLTGSLRETVEKNLAACYGIDSKVARFLHRAVTEGERTLETGSGLSTIIFAIRKAYHTVVTPNKGEAAAIKEYARANHIGIERVDFVRRRRKRICQDVLSGISTSCSSTANTLFRGRSSTGFTLRIN